MIPIPMLYVKLMSITVASAGTDSEKSEKSIFLTDSIIRMPTKIRAGPYARAGMDVKRGAKKSARTNINAVTTAENPLFPPVPQGV